MSKVIEISDEQYGMLAAAAAREHETPEGLMQQMLEALAATQGPVYFTGESLLRALGADDAELATLDTLDASDDDADV